MLLIFRTQFLGLWLLSFIWETLNLQRGRKWIHLSLKMRSPDSICKLLLNFSCKELLSILLHVKSNFKIGISRHILMRFWVLIFIMLFRCDAKALEDSLCKRIMVTRDETITKSLDPESAALSRDALAKIVYSRLFDW